MVKTMIGIYCHKFHKIKTGLCSNCQDLLDYALNRLDKCIYGEYKPTCAKCKVHCYKTDMREKIKTVMRYSGPRMIYRHPLMLFMHLYRLKI